MQKYKHVCSCGNKYEDSDPEVYFCPSCVAKRKEIAKQVDLRIANRPVKKKIRSDYEILQQNGHSRGQATFVRASDLGITF